ncbi:MAG: TetR family transcriptional regulator [Acidimicrobiia bacterium]|nr:TetR family transcriptional regulator [Acidimicrobiia bacterium]
MARAGALARRAARSAPARGPCIPPGTPSPHGQFITGTMPRTGARAPTPLRGGSTGHRRTRTNEQTHDRRGHGTRVGAVAGPLGPARLVPGGPLAPRLPAAVRRRQLLDVAIGVFSHRGFHSTSMTDVAEAAGVTKPVLYQHFSSKRALYLEVLGDVGLRLRQAIEKATTDAPGPREQVERGLDAFFAFVAEEQEAFTLLFGSGTRRDEEFAAFAAQVERSIAQSVAGLLEVSGLGDAERELLAFAIVGLAEGSARHWIASGLVPPVGELAGLVGRVAWAGLRGLSAADPG